MPRSTTLPSFEPRLVPPLPSDPASFDGYGDDCTSRSSTDIEIEKSSKIRRLEYRWLIDEVHQSSPEGSRGCWTLSFHNTLDGVYVELLLCHAHAIHDCGRRTVLYAILGTEPFRQYVDGLEEIQSNHISGRGKLSIALQTPSSHPLVAGYQSRTASLTPASASPSTAQVLPTTIMSALNTCLKVANITEASGLPYVKNVAKVAVVVFKLLEQKGKNKKNAEELCQSIADTIVVVDTLVRMQGERGTSCYIDICGEMERYLESMAQDIKDIKLKHRGLKGVFCVDEFRDAIQAYRRRVDDLKMDFVIHSVGDCRLEVTQMHGLLKNATTPAVVRHSEEFVFRILKKPVAITAFFFFYP